MRVLALIWILASTTLANGQAGSTPVDAIKEVIKESYVDGFFNEGNLRNIELGFADEFRMIDLRDDNSVKILSLPVWVAKVDAKIKAGAYPPPPEKMVRVDYVRIDVEEDIAVVKLKFYVGNQFRYIDFITLMHFEEGWKIIGKAFREIPKSEP